LRTTIPQEDGTSGIDRLIGIIGGSHKNTRGPILINEVKNEIITLDRTIDIPRIEVSRINYETIAGPLRELTGVIPEYLSGHTLLVRQKPPSETHFIHFVKTLRGLHRDFVHIFKLDFRFSSDLGKNYHDGTADFYPSYTIDKIPFKSLLVPVAKITEEDGRVADFSTLKIIDEESVEGSDNYFVHSIFDDFDATGINERILDEAGRDIFSFSPRIYPFFVYGYFTVGMNLPDPVPAELEDAVSVFEPIMAKVTGSFGGKAVVEEIASAYDHDLVCSNGILAYRDTFAERARRYFTRYSIFHDDELALRRWWRINVAR
jgi:hypothetical protein